MILSAIGTLAGLGTSIYGAVKQSQAAKEEKKLMADTKAKQEDWYRRNYYQDYLNSVGAQNAMKKYRDAWEDQVKEARARQVVSGGTPAMVQATMEAGAEGYGNLVGNLAAQGEQNKQAIDAQKLSMDVAHNGEQMKMAQQEQQAGATLLGNGIGVMQSSLAGLELPTKSKTPEADTSVAGKITDGFKETPLELPKTIKPLQL